MNVLVACEESQEVCKAFRERGHNAFSCDIKPCSGGHPEWHIWSNVRGLLGKTLTFKTADGKKHNIPRWDLIVAHPPCTYLSVAGNRWFDIEKYGNNARTRWNKRIVAEFFFMEFVRADCEKIAIENPVGRMNTVYRQPDQIIQPYMFGDSYARRTCLWLKNLKPLVPTNIIERPPEGWQNQSFDSTGKNRGFGSKFRDPTVRSKTFPGIAKAMADQWG
jgi:hypothetical protein